MIGTVTKPMEEIYHYLQGEKKVIVVGCDGCARISHTGGEPEVNSMADKLEEKGFNVIARILPERTCYIHKTKKSFAPYDMMVMSIILCHQERGINTLIFI